MGKVEAEDYRKGRGEMEKFQQDLYKLSAKYIKNDQPSTLFMCCGVMLKTCIEMYTSVLSDEGIEKILAHANESVPYVRQGLDDIFTKTTFH
tara:strand:- start:116 stop:391 length:276 start_codon:yes stop_codon:yes gene_type:complete